MLVSLDYSHPSSHPTDQGYHFHQKSTGIIAQDSPILHLALTEAAGIFQTRLEPGTFGTPGGKNKSHVPGPILSGRHTISHLHQTSPHGNFGPFLPPVMRLCAICAAIPMRCKGRSPLVSHLKYLCNAAGARVSVATAQSTREYELQFEDCTSNEPHFATLGTASFVGR